MTIPFTKISKILRWNLFCRKFKWYCKTKGEKIKYNYIIYHNCTEFNICMKINVNNYAKKKSRICKMIFPAAVMSASFKLRLHSWKSELSSILWAWWRQIERQCPRLPKKSTWNSEKRQILCWQPKKPHCIWCAQWSKLKAIDSGHWVDRTEFQWKSCIEIVSCCHAAIRISGNWKWRQKSDACRGAENDIWVHGQKFPRKSERLW